MRRGKREEWLKKYERLQGLEAFLEEHEAAAKPDVEYIKGLKERIRRLRVQLQVMSDVGDDKMNVRGKQKE